MQLFCVILLVDTWKFSLHTRIHYEPDDLLHDTGSDLCWQSQQMRRPPSTANLSSIDEQRFPIVEAFH